MSKKENIEREAKLALKACESAILYGRSQYYLKQFSELVGMANDFKKNGIDINAEGREKKLIELAIESWDKKAEYMFYREHIAKPVRWMLDRLVKTAAN